MEHLSILSGNQLKLLAMLTMLTDHIGMILFPRLPVFRIIGRLAMPLFAYMIAEGCRYTRRRSRYFLSVAGLGVLCQLAFSISAGSLYQNILLTFSLSIATVFAVDRAIADRSTASVGSAVLVIGCVLFLTLCLPSLLNGFAVDYGLFGVLLPVAVYYAPDKLSRVAACGLVLTGLALVSKPVQWFALLALPLLLLYNGKRGKRQMKYLFYLFYPLHLLLLQGVKLLLS